MRNLTGASVRWSLVLFTLAPSYLLAETAFLRNDILVGVPPTLSSLAISTETADLTWL